MLDVSEPYIIGLRADLERDEPDLLREMEQARIRAAAVDAELSALLTRLEHARAALETAQSEAARLITVVGEKNLRCSTLHQEIAAFKRRADDLQTEMERVGDGAIYRRLRRDRARNMVQVSDRETELARVHAEVEANRKSAVEAEARAVAERDRARAITGELDRLQGELPQPELFIRLFETRLGLAHTRFFLDRSPKPWQQALREAIGSLAELHRELRAGKYRLDRNSDVVGGRATATGEAVYGAVALGDDALAVQLFQLATDPGLFFHDIFNVFRVWCAGLYLTGQLSELRELLRIHQYAEGLRAGYVQCFFGLLNGEAKRIEDGLKIIVRDEWNGWQKASRTRGAGVINLTAAAVIRWARDRGLRVQAPSATVPQELVMAVLSTGERRGSLPASSVTGERRAAPNVRR